MNSNTTKADSDAAREYYETHSAEDEIANAVPGEPITSPMSGYSVRLPTAVLNAARKIASERNMTTGAWMRDVIEKAIAAAHDDDRSEEPEAVPVNDLIAFLSKYRRGSSTMDWRAFFTAPDSEFFPQTTLVVNDATGHNDLILRMLYANTDPELDSARREEVEVPMHGEAVERFNNLVSRVGVDVAHSPVRIYVSKNKANRRIVQRVTQGRRRTKS